jgi:negative regulator of flagellin synthesis FlgM
MSVSNKISGYQPAAPLAPVRGVSNGTAATNKSPDEAGTAAANNAQPGDQVTLTESARSLQKIQEAVDQAPVVNSGKVAAIKRAVQGGTYQVDAGRVAAGLLRFDAELS